MTTCGGALDMLCLMFGVKPFIYLYRNFTPFNINDGAAQATHSSSTLIISLDQLTK